MPVEAVWRPLRPSMLIGYEASMNMTIKVILLFQHFYVIPKNIVN